jgi:hypothetical protein
MLGETGFEEKYCMNISATYCFAITYSLKFLKGTPPA